MTRDRHGLLLRHALVHTGQTCATVRVQVTRDRHGLLLQHVLDEMEVVDEEENVYRIMSRDDVGEEDDEEKWEEQDEEEERE